MNFLVRHRLPNFAGGDSIHPNELEHKEIKTLSELDDFQFIKDQKEMGYTTILLVKAERDEYTQFDYFICSEIPGQFKTRAWVGKMVEHDPLKDDPLKNDLWRF